MKFDTQFYKNLLLTVCVAYTIIILIMAWFIVNEKDIADKYYVQQFKDLIKANSNCFYGSEKWNMTDWDMTELSNMSFLYYGGANNVSQDNR